MNRRNFENNGLNLSFLDSGGDGPIVITLHSHWLESGTFLPIAELLGPSWRVIALDQRGHGHSDHAPTYTRADYLDDLTALLIIYRYQAQ
jgi:esterase